MVKRQSTWAIGLSILFLICLSFFMLKKHPGDFSINFVANLFATLIGVILGFPTAQLLEEIRTKRIQTERANYLLNVIRAEITHDRALLNQILDELVPNAVIFYSLRLGTWKSITSQDLDNIDDMQLVEQVSRLYFEFEHLNRKIDEQFQMHYSAIRASTEYGRLRTGVVGAIRVHATNTIPVCDNVLNSLEERLGILE